LSRHTDNVSAQANVTHTEATTILAFKFDGGVLVAGDRRATAGNVVVYDRADKVLEIATSGSWQLRHPVGPDAAPFLGWRRQMSDEAWVDFGAMDDDAWYDRVKADFGLDARPAM